MPLREARTATTEWECADGVSEITRLEHAEIPQLVRWWSGTASIRRPPVFQTGALPTELPDLPDQIPVEDLAGGSDGI